MSQSERECIHDILEKLHNKWMCYFGIVSSTVYTLHRAYMLLDETFKLTTSYTMRYGMSAIVVLMIGAYTGDNHLPRAQCRNSETAFY